jgi:hypothetical protein
VACGRENRLTAIGFGPLEVLIGAGKEGVSVAIDRRIDFKAARCRGKFTELVTEPNAARRAPEGTAHRRSSLAIRPAVWESRQQKWFSNNICCKWNRPTEQERRRPSCWRSGELDLGVRWFRKT